MQPGTSRSSSVYLAFEGSTLDCCKWVIGRDGHKAGENIELKIMSCWFVRNLQSGTL